MSCGRVLVSGVPDRGVDAALGMSTVRSSRPDKGLGGARSELESESTKPAHDGGICCGRPEEIDRGVRGRYWGRAFSGVYRLERLEEPEADGGRGSC